MDYKTLFLDNEGVLAEVTALVATRLLGEQVKQLIDRRYRDMQCNFYNVTQWFADKHKHEDFQTWKFSEDVVPFAPKGRVGYTDTTSATIPIHHTNFEFLSTMARNVENKHRGAIGLDLPTWFGANMPQRVMIVTQDPLRNPYWYGNKEKSDNDPNHNPEDYVCADAVVSSPFGLHSREHREYGGGQRMWLLVQELLSKNVGVYLTDCRKFFYYSHEESNGLMKNAKYNLRNIYNDILREEIEILKPHLIVPLGKEANKYIRSAKLDTPVLYELPHFSGAAGGAIVRSEILNVERGSKITDIAKSYAEVIYKMILSGL